MSNMKHTLNITNSRLDMTEARNLNTKQDKLSKMKYKGKTKTGQSITGRSNAHIAGFPMEKRETPEKEKYLKIMVEICQIC